MKRAREPSISLSRTDEQASGARMSADKSVAKLTHSDLAASQPVVECNLPPHEPQSFSSMQSYEDHYVSTHTFQCSECHHNFPTEHYLELHLNECHNPIKAAQKDAGEKIYACFVLGCDKICADWKKRRNHLIDKHGFPRNYDFFMVWNGIDGRQSLLRPGVDEQGHRKSRPQQKNHSSNTTRAVPNSPGGESSPDARHEVQLNVYNQAKKSAGKSRLTGVDAGDIVANMDDVTARLSTLKMVPRSITFGRQAGKSGFSKRP